MTSLWTRWRLKSQAPRLFTKPFVRAQIKENTKAPRHWPLLGEFPGDRWIPRKGSVTRKIFPFDDVIMTLEQPHDYHKPQNQSILWVYFGSGNDLLSHGTKPLPESMLTYHQWDLFTFHRAKFHRNSATDQPLQNISKWQYLRVLLHLKILNKLTGNIVRMFYCIRHCCQAKNNSSSHE